MPTKASFVSPLLSRDGKRKRITLEKQTSALGSGSGNLGVLLSGKDGVTDKKPPESAGQSSYLPRYQLSALWVRSAALLLLQPRPSRNSHGSCLFSGQCCAPVWATQGSHASYISQASTVLPMPREGVGEKVPTYLLWWRCAVWKSTSVACSWAIIIISLLTNNEIEDEEY